MSAFARWMREVDAHVCAIAGVSVHDLPDCPFWDWHEDGVSARSAARRALKYAGW